MTPNKIQADSLRRFAESLLALADRIHNNEFTHVSGISKINVESDGPVVRSISISANTKYKPTQP